MMENVCNYKRYNLTRLKFQKSSLRDVLIVMLRFQQKNEPADDEF